ncbi:MAG: HAD family hydrolase [bacterium]
MIQLAIFDMDGLMFDTERIVGEILIDLANQRGYPMTMRERLMLLGRAEKDNRKILSDCFGEDFPYDDIMRARKKSAQAYYQRHGVPIKKGLMELLQYLKSHHIPIAVCSSSNQEIIKQHLTRTGTASYIDYCIGGDMVSQSKPDPAIFLNACRHFHVAPENAMVFEDSRNGILAANNAHIPVICIPDLESHSPEFLQHTYATVASLSDVIPLLEK